jgi:hypothetical protein
MTLDKFNELIDDALVEVGHGMIVNASGFRGAELEHHLGESFDLLIELERGTRKVAAQKFGPTP